MADLAPILARFAISHESIDVQHLVLDSRKIKTGDAFIAIKGHSQDGGLFVESALANGAAIALVDEQCECTFASDKIIRVAQLDKKLAQLSAQFYGKPSEELALIGVTGTNGKSTITSMIAYLAQVCGSKSAVIGTLGWGHPDKLNALANTTPSSVELQAILAQLHQASHQVVAMEVSSHGLVQGRVACTRFKAAVFSNLSRDHLDYHGDMQSYADAKLMLFTECNPEISVINQDDEVAKLWLMQPELMDAVVYGQGKTTTHTGRYVLFDDVQYSGDGLSAQFYTSWGNTEIKCPLYGQFNLYNLAAAFATLLALGYSIDLLAQAVSKLSPVAGRMQPFSEANKPTCVVDYAHTPDALALALQALQLHVPGKVTCVFGCGGNRDKGKRALMAQAAERFANKIIVTSDNPRNEDPKAIIADILAGFNDTTHVLSEEDREQAIKMAIEQAEPEEVILIAGKGHEDYQLIGTQVLPFCDRAQVVKYLKGYGQ